MVHDSNAILKQFLEESSSNRIPAQMVQDAKAIMIFSDSVRAGLFISGSFAQGVALVREGNGWSAPAFFRMSGMGLGLQIGGDVTDAVFVIRDEEGLKHLLENHFTMGADASAAAGKKGRQFKAETNKDSHIISYGKSKGLFAGMSFDGNVIKQDAGANEKYYGKKLDAREILLEGKAPVTAEAADLISTLQKHD